MVNPSELFKHISPILLFKRGEGIFFSCISSRASLFVFSYSILASFVSLALKIDNSSYVSLLLPSLRYLAFNYSFVKEFRFSKSRSCIRLLFQIEISKCLFQYFQLRLDSISVIFVCSNSKWMYYFQVTWYYSNFFSNNFTPRVAIKPLRQNVLLSLVESYKKKTFLLKRENKERPGIKKAEDWDCI